MLMKKIPALFCESKIEYYIDFTTANPLHYIWRKITEAIEESSKRATTERLFY